MTNISDAIKLSNANISATAQSYLPEPSSSGMGIFKDILGVVGAIGGNFLGTRTGLLNNALSENALPDTNNELLMTQIEMQREMQVTSMVSNVEKSKHEAQMQPIRNIRVS